MTSCSQIQSKKIFNLREQVASSTCSSFNLIDMEDDEADFINFPFKQWTIRIPINYCHEIIYDMPIFSIDEKMLEIQIILN